MVPLLEKLQLLPKTPKCLAFTYVTPANKTAKAAAASTAEKWKTDRLSVEGVNKMTPLMWSMQESPTYG